MAVSVQIPTVKPAPNLMGMRTGKHTHSATPHTSGRCGAFPTSDTFEKDI